MALRLQQKLGLHQRLTPQQVQYLKLLQLPAAELEEKIKEELESNPLLEEATEEEAQHQAEDNPTLILESATQQPVIETTAPKEASDTPERNDYSIEDFMNDELEGFKAPRNTRQFDDDDERQDKVPVANESLAESLIGQLKLQNVSPRLIVLAEEIIGSLDDNGYLRTPIEQIVDDTNIYYGEEYSVSEAVRLVRRIQHLDPPGIAAQNLQECLRIQLEAMPESEPSRDLALLLINEYFDDYINKKYDIIAKKLKVNVIDLKPADQLIQRLDPKPGQLHSTSDTTRYITPDFFIERAPNGEFTITLNERGVPPLRINAAYKQLTKKNAPIRKETRQEVKKFINEKFQSAKDFLIAIYQRRATLVKVMQAIVERQREFFEKGERYLRPLIYKTVAEDSGLDISTISRVVNGKYCQCEHGVFELKYFFSEAIASDTGEESVANKVIKSRIKAIIDSEDPAAPYSDEKLVAILKEDGYTVARRTIAKYREEMRIPPARLRRKIV